MNAQSDTAPPSPGNESDYSPDGDARRRSDSESGALPSYAAELEAFHRAFAEELRELIAMLPCRPTDRVVDVGCGDGFYARLFAERLRTPGGVVGLDANGEYLELARRITSSAEHAPVRYVQADWREAASVVDGPCDVVWCAQSLFSFDEPVSVLRALAELARPGGIVAVMEGDSLHQLFMPWSSRMEMALRSAEREAFEHESSHPSKFYVGRRLPAVLAAAGLEPLGYFTQSIDRMAPLDADLKQFLQSYLEKLHVRAGPFISSELREELQSLIRPTSDRYLLNQPQFTMTWFNVLAWGRRPV